MAPSDVPSSRASSRAATMTSSSISSVVRTAMMLTHQRITRTEAVFLERYGRPAAVLVSPERYERLLAAFEDAEDVVAFDAALAEEGADIPWEQAKADLGWE